MNALEAEKPADDAKACAIKVRSECFIDTSQTDRACFVWDVDTAAMVIQSFAESYHAKKCADCNMRLTTPSEDQK